MKFENNYLNINFYQAFIWIAIKFKVIDKEKKRQREIFDIIRIVELIMKIIAIISL